MSKTTRAPTPARHAKGLVQAGKTASKPTATPAATAHRSANAAQVQVSK
jgi:hypothetical protein